jgi:Tol biopolymer transport system component
MGEVYRARDSKLKREVALKVLPSDVATDRERLARFQREAEVLAALNHPNIAHVYGLEDNALVMELVEGDDLAERLARGPMHADEALPIAKQIAEALETAHEAGIIHRDLKPANVKVRPDGTVKVLDFGLAKALQDPKTSGPQDLSHSPTITSPAMTMRGVILGTAAYMSPEQAKGKPVDKRTDTWAFGCVLYEMLTGTKAFDGEDVTDTIVAVMSKDPDWPRLHALPIPPATERLIRRCLVKDRRNRLPDIAVARIEIDEAANATVAAPAGAAAPPERSRGTMIGVGAVLLALVAAATGYMMAPRAPTAVENLYRSSLLVTENLSPRAPSFRFAISPDGRRLAYAATTATTPRDGSPTLWIRTLSGTSAASVAESDNAASPFWSPDSRFVAFFADGQLKRADISGGPAVTICSFDQRSVNTSGSWNTGGVIVFRHRTVIARVNASGGEPQDITELDSATGETSHNFPFFLPDGKRFLFTAYRGLAPLATYVGSIDGGKPTRLMDGGSNAQYARGMVLFMPGSDVGFTETTLMARPFDADRLAFTGAPVLVAERVLPNLTTVLGGAFSVSSAGALVYQSAAALAGVRLAWSTRTGQQTPVINETASYRSLELSHDGRRVLVTPMDVGGRADAWMYALDRGTRTRLTFDGRTGGAIWSPDDESIVFAKIGSANASGPLPVGNQTTAAAGPSDLYRKRIDSANEEVMYADDRAKLPLSFSRDGRVFVFDRFEPSTGNDIWKLPLDGSEKASSVAATRFWERWAQVSPNGKWLAYATAESSASDVVVIRVDGRPGRWQVSATGGNYPRWSHDGSELYFHTADNKIAATKITETNDRIDFGPIVPLFDARAAEGFGRFFYDVAPDGRFLLSVPANTNLTSELAFITNWPALLAR